ncbi:MAG: LysR family transcriptional regulator [Propionibacteriaceae bacterium]|nr:LysR family transcriptional regulator [Propionibacteriaceae bacterium]
MDIAASPLPRLDPRRLLVFRAVVQAGTVGGGARALGWTQPAVSQHLAALERAAGAPLLLRSPRGVALTEAGRAALAHADAIAAHLVAADNELAGFANLQSGTVRLAAFPSALAVLVPEALETLQRQGAAIEVALTEAEPPEAAKLTQAGTVDLALSFAYSDVGDDPLPGYLCSIALGADEVVLVAPRGHPVLSQNNLTFAELAAEAWVAGCQRCRNHLVRVAERAGFSPRIRHETDDYVVVQSIVARGLALAVLPTTALRAYAHPGVAVRALPDLAGRTVNALFHQGAGQIPAVACVLRALQSATASALGPAAPQGG